LKPCGKVASANSPSSPGTGWRGAHTAAVAILAVLALPAVAEPVTTFRDAMGRVQGYGATRGNSATFSNARGQQTERAPNGGRTARLYLLRQHGAAGRHGAQRCCQSLWALMIISTRRFLARPSRVAFEAIGFASP
jgi:hypothetical protein